MAQPQTTTTLVPGFRGLHRLGRGALRFARKQPLGLAGILMVLIVIAGAIFAPLLGTGDPNMDDFTIRLRGPSGANWFGTDEYGRDLWTRILFGARISLEVGFISVFTGSILGLAIGVATGYVGGMTDTITERLVEIMLSIPAIVLALALMAALGSGVDKVIIAIAITFLPRTIRIMRGTVLSVKENVYIEAARAIGAATPRILFRHILPNVMAPYLIVASSLLGAAILIEATLSFLGLGIPPPHPSWGRMLAGNLMSYAMSAPWMVVFPGAALSVIVLGFNLFGDALRDMWDPRLRGRL
ncbi:MAG: ABC transporter permease [Dehalococcoidia bacterium]|nr:ABC transporter permease [Dehalococcoidia bacterium]